MAEVERDPVTALRLEPLVQFQKEGKTLGPHEGISVYPPYIFAESSSGVSVEALPRLVILKSNADLARDSAPWPAGTRFKVHARPHRRWWHRFRRSKS